MKTIKKSLQRLTETETKFNLLMKKKKLLPCDIDTMLDRKEKDQFGTFLTKLLNEKKGDELANFIEQISDIIPQGVKNQLWENNHYRITLAITKLMEDYGKMPTKNQIAEESGLSRQTISKHLKNYQTNPLYAEEMQKFKFMADRVLSKVYKIAISCGDVKAARLYLEVLGYLGNQSGINTTINTQNNYLQINQTKINQETIKHLTADQLIQIEGILKAVLPLPDTLPI